VRHCAPAVKGRRNPRAVRKADRFAAGGIADDLAQLDRSALDHLRFDHRTCCGRFYSELGVTPMKKLVVFDLDGTLAPSKSSLDPEMAALLGRLLGIVKVAIISGGALAQFEKQVLALLPQGEGLKNLSLLPTCGAQFYLFDGAWKKLYSEDFSAAEKTTIIAGLNRAVDQAGMRASTHWGELIEDRDSQITFSALGQQAPLPDKQKWDPDFAKRKTNEGILAPMIPGFSIRLGGATSIDITRPGVDKGYGIGKLRQTLGIEISDMIFVGDAIFPGGNDYPAKQAGVESIRVRDPDETKRVIEAICACLEPGSQ
jgi:HAD superfamily hydrolase (TIGR01484 family)